MILTIEKLEKLGACEGARIAFLEQKENNVYTLLDLMLDTGRSGWARWLLSRLLAKENQIRLAIFCAEQVLPIFENKYPLDTRPRDAIDAARNVLSGGKVADAAAYADAAYAAAYAAAAAAAYAADAAAAYEINKKIISYGTELLRGQEND